MRRSIRGTVFQHFVGLVCSAIAAVACGAQSGPAKDAAAPVFAWPAADLQALERLAVDVRTLGRDEDAAVVKGALQGFGATAAQLVALDRRLAAAKPQTRDAERGAAKAGDQLGKLCATMAARLPTCRDPELRARWARALLDLDDQCAAAHAALGHVLVGDRWLTAEQNGLRARESRIQEAVQQARRLPVQIEVVESAHPLLLVANGKPGRVARGHGVELHSHWPEARLRRVVAGLAQAIALSDYLINDSHITAPSALGLSVVHVSDSVAYRKLLKADIKSGDTPITAKEADERNHWSRWNYWRHDSSTVIQAAFDVDLVSYMFSLSRRSELASEPGDAPRFIWVPSMSTIAAGHGNWVLSALVGGHLPRFIIDLSSAQASTRVREDDPTLRMMMSAGLMGVRSWLRSEVSAGSDPAWSRSFKPHVFEVDGVDLLKTTFVVEYLQQKGPLGPLLTKTRVASRADQAEMTKAIEAALGESLAEFEARWRAWMRGTGGGDSLRAQLGVSARVDNGAGTLLNALTSFRRAAHTHPWLSNLPTVRVEASLVAGARAHAQYLALHPEQLVRWPDMHEQYADREGFSPEGAWAGSHSVIVPGVTAPVAALDQWMGTFFHRLPLLDPGLLRVGWALEQGVAVLDTGSIVRAFDTGWEVVWPPDGRKDVPRRFVPELPSPVPGLDQGKWGYPITLQMGPRANQSQPEVVMTLREGAVDGREVECLFSSPQAPGNPALVPGLAWCLIPTEALQPGTTYHVQAELRSGELAAGGTTMQWSFRTGR